MQRIPMDIDTFTTNKSVRWANVNNLSGWLACQEQKLKRHNFNFGDDDRQHLEDDIRQSPMGLSRTIEWPTGRWHLMIRKHGDIWQAATVLEERA